MLEDLLDMLAWSWAGILVLLVVASRIDSWLHDPPRSTRM